MFLKNNISFPTIFVFCLSFKGLLIYFTDIIHHTVAYTVWMTFYNQEIFDQCKSIFSFLLNSGIYIFFRNG